MYIFRPHGSKHISDLYPLSDDDEWKNHFFPAVICHDQEPLNFQAHTNLTNSVLRGRTTMRDNQKEFLSNKNLKLIPMQQGNELYDKIILLHSEQNSLDVEQYGKNNYIPVHYWSHAVIARDWFRFAKHDPRLTGYRTARQLFNIHCRAWTNTREYRLKFVELLREAELLPHSQLSIMHKDDGNTLLNYEFTNSKLELKSRQFFDEIKDNCYGPAASADYEPSDYTQSDVSVVLETIFDSQKIHLTEKILKPIACGHPFILAAGPGALKYLKHYGFETFAPWIDESYDQETDSVARLEAIVRSMKKIQSMTPEQMSVWREHVAAVAQFNQQHFFSDAFMKMITKELRDNLKIALSQAKITRGTNYLKLRGLSRSLSTCRSFTHQYWVDRLHILQQLRKDPTTDLRIFDPKWKNL